MTLTGLKELPQKVNLPGVDGLLTPSNVDINRDINRDVEPDLEYDLDRLPWPLPAGHFTEVFAYDVIEHCVNVLAVMEEIHRVTREGAVVRITVPHFSCANAFTDPTHRHFFGISSFNYVTGYDTKGRFRSGVRNLIFYPYLLNRLARPMANRWPKRYERRWTMVRRWEHEDIRPAQNGPSVALVSVTTETPGWSKRSRFIAAASSISTARS